MPAKPQPTFRQQPDSRLLPASSRIAGPASGGGTSRGFRAESGRASWGGGSSGGGSGGGQGKAGLPKRDIVKTWAFDSIGPRKYALQILKAFNGNPALLFVEGKKQEDGSYRKNSVYVWSEDFERLFATLDEVRAFMRANNIRTPPGHKYDPSAKPKWNGKRSAPSQRSSGRG